MSDRDSLCSAAERSGPEDVSVEYELVSGGENREAQAIYQYKGQCVGKAEVVLKASYYKKMAGKSDPNFTK